MRAERERKRERKQREGESGVEIGRVVGEN